MIDLKDEDELHRKMCTFCGSIYSYKQHFSANIIDCCEASTKYKQLYKYSASPEVLQWFLDSSAKYFDANHGLHGEVFTDAKDLTSFFEYSRKIILKNHNIQFAS